MANRGLTLKQKTFADEYIISLDATKSAIKAGYKESTARQQGYLLKNNPEIKKYIEDRLEEKNDKLIAKQDEVLRYLTRVMRGQDMDDVIVNGEVVKVVKQDNRIKCAELLGRRYSLFEDNVNVRGDMSVTFVDDLEE